MSRVSRGDLEVNGKKVDFVKIEEDETDLAEVVKLMKGSDTIDKTPVYKLTITYAKPTGKPFDWTSANGGTITLAEDDGERITWGGCKVLKIGKAGLDDDKAKEYDIDIWAKNRTVE